MPEKSRLFDSIPFLDLAMSWLKLSCIALFSLYVFAFDTFDAHLLSLFSFSLSSSFFITHMVSNFLTLSFPFYFIHCVPCMGRFSAGVLFVSFRFVVSHIT